MLFNAGIRRRDWCLHLFSLCLIQVGLYSMYLENLSDMYIVYVNDLSYIHIVYVYDFFFYINTWGKY